MTAPTPTWIDSFQHQFNAATSYGSNAGVYDAIGRSAGLTFVTGRQGAGTFALQVVEDGVTNTFVRKTVAAGNRTIVESLYFNISAIPSVDSHFWSSVASGTGKVGMKASTGNLFYVAAGAGAGHSVTGNWADSAWHRLDVKLDTSGTTYTLDVAIDGAAQTQDTVGSQTAADISSSTLGSGTATHTLTVQFADWVRSLTSGDHPIGAHQVNALIPNADGTHNWASTNMGPATGGVASSVTTLYQEVDDFATVVADTTTYIQYANAVATSTEYAEITLPDVTSGTTVWGARAVAAILSASTVANSATTRVVDGSGATVLDLYTGDQSDTTPRYQASMLSAITDTTTLNALKYRVGFPTDSSPAPQWSALMIEYATPGVAAGTDQFFPVVVGA